MQERKVLNKEKPVMVLRYSAPRVALFVFIFFPFGLALFSPLFMEPSETISTFDRYFVGYGAPILGILVIWLILDLLNTKQIEVYKDRIVKIKRFFILPFLGKREVKLEGQIFIMRNSFGISFSNSNMFSFPSLGCGILTSRLEKEEEMKFAEFLSKITGESINYFLYRPFTDFWNRKFMIKGGHNGPRK